LLACWITAPRADPLAVSTQLTLRVTAKRISAIITLNKSDKGGGWVESDGLVELIENETVSERMMSDVKYAQHHLS